MNTTDGSSSTAASGVPAPQCQSLHVLLRRRALLAQRVSWGVLVAILLLLCGGSFLVVNPPGLLPRVEYYDEFTPVYSLWYSDDAPGANTSDTSPPLEMTAGEKELLSRLKKLQERLDEKEATDAEQARQLTALQSKDAGIENQLIAVKKAVDEVKEQPLQERKHWEALFGTFLTRFGIAALVLLLMRFMNSIYRYHARMAAFYDAKADVFEACGGDVNAMEKLSHILTPSGVDFHETADTIMEHAVDLAKKATAS